MAFYLRKKNVLLSELVIKEGEKSVTNIDLHVYVCIYWRRQWQPTPVLLPGKSYGWRSLVGCGPWGR